MQKITAREITKALAKRHKEDMFFTEVKDGPTGFFRRYVRSWVLLHTTTFSDRRSPNEP